MEFDAIMNGEGGVITGWQNKLQATIASIFPADITAELHKNMAEPSNGKTVRPPEGSPRPLSVNLRA